MATCQITIDIDMSDTSDILGCSICREVIQSATHHNSCMGCGANVCTPCRDRNVEEKQFQCPMCRSNKGYFVNRLITTKIYPMLTLPCLNEGCDVMAVSVAAHMGQCIFRQVECLVCDRKVPARDYNCHMLACESGQWTRATTADFENKFHQLVGPTKDNTHWARSVWCMATDLRPNEADQKMVTSASRILYAWMDVHMAILNMTCIQMNCTSVKEKVLIKCHSSTDEDTMRSISIPVNSIEDINGPAIVTVSLAELAQFDKFAITGGICPYAVGARLQVDVDRHGDWTWSRLLEIQTNPSRMVFITLDPRQKIVNIPLYGTEATKRVRSLENANHTLSRDEMLFAVLMATGSGRSLTS